MKLVRLFGRLLAISLAIIGAVTIANILWHKRSTPTPDDVAQRLSPDGTFKAVLIDYFGGGGISPYCFGYVTIVPTKASDAAAISRDNLVFSYDVCDSFSPQKGQMRGSPLVERLANDQLKITFAINQSRLIPRTFQMRSSDGGLLMAATKDTFVASNPAHIAVARDIEAGCTQFNDAPWPPKDV